MGITLAFLGTGTCNAADRNPQCLAFSDGTSVILMDAGGGCYHQLARLGLKNFSPDRIDAVILTHFHVDHVSGIPDIIWGQMWDVKGPRERPLVITGPPGIRDFLDTRLVPFVGGYEIPFPIDAREFTPGEEKEIGFLTVRSVPLAHGAASTGYMVVADGMKLAVTGDTGYCDALPGFLRGADAAVIEWSFTDDREHPKHITATDIKRLLKEDALPLRVYVCHVYPAHGRGFHEQVRGVKDMLGEDARRFVFPEDGYVTRLA